MVVTVNHNDNTIVISVGKGRETKGFVYQFKNDANFSDFRSMLSGLFHSFGETFEVFEAELREINDDTTSVEEW